MASSSEAPPPANADAEIRADNADNAKAGIGNLVASHYNNLDEKGVETRKDSRIFYMRNLNNWIKSQLINEYASKIRSSMSSSSSRSFQVLDLGCGKGGDLLKWQKAGITHFVGVDIAETSVEQCTKRYHDMKNRRNMSRLFSAEFYAADCTKANLVDLYRKKDILFDIVSCQFAFHYCFESLAQADCMLKNISECLKPGGYFIGTTPDSYDIIHRLKDQMESEQKAGQELSYSTGNGVYNIRLEDEDMKKHLREDPSKIPLFGAKYLFHLEGVVDCPEFLVYFPALVKLAERHGLIMIAKRRFTNYFHQFKDQGKDLLTRMSALETYPPTEGTKLVGEDSPGNYDHAEEFLKTAATPKCGTLSKEEWEAATIYIIFAFKKMST